MFPAIKANLKRATKTCKLFCNIAAFWRWGGGGGTGVHNKVLYVDVPPRDQTPYHFICHFWKKRYPFWKISLTNAATFTYLVNPFRLLQMGCLWNMKKSQIPLGLFYIPKWQISLPFYILQILKSLSFHLPKAWKRYAFRADSQYRPL